MSGKLRIGQLVSFQKKEPFGRRDTTIEGYIKFIEADGIYIILGDNGTHYEVHRKRINLR